MLEFSVVVLKTELTKGSGFIRGTECNIYLLYNTETNVIFRFGTFYSYYRFTSNLSYPTLDVILCVIRSCYCGDVFLTRTNKSFENYIFARKWSTEEVLLCERGVC